MSSGRPPALGTWEGLETRPWGLVAVLWVSGVAHSLSLLGTVKFLLRKLCLDKNVSDVISALAGQLAPEKPKPLG